MVHQRDAALLLAVALHHKLHREFSRAVFLQIDRRGSRHIAVHCEVDGQAFHLLVALVNDAHHQVVGQTGLHNGRRQPNRVDVKIGLELGHHRDDDHLHRRVGLSRRQIEGVRLEIRIDKQGRSLKAMLLAQHLETVDDFTHWSRRAVRVHTVKLVEHLLLVHRIFVLDLEAVGHQQVTIGGIKFVYQIPCRLSCILNHGGALRLSLHAHRIVDVDANEIILRIDIQLFLRMIWKGKSQYQCCDEQAAQQQGDEIFQLARLGVLLLNASQYSRIAEIHQLMPPEIEQVDKDGNQQGKQAPKHIGIEETHINGSRKMNQKPCRCFPFPRRRYRSLANDEQASS